MMSPHLCIATKCRKSLLNSLILKGDPRDPNANENEKSGMIFSKKLSEDAG